MARTSDRFSSDEPGKETKRDYANTLARTALRRATVDEESRLHAGRRLNAGVGHRREHGHFYRVECGGTAPAGLRSFRAIGGLLGIEPREEFSAPDCVGAQLH